MKKSNAYLNWIFQKILSIQKTYEYYAYNNRMDVLFQFIETYSRYKLPDSINKIGYSKSRGLSKCQEYLFWRQRCVFKINAANTKVIYAVYITQQTIHSKFNA